MPEAKDGCVSAAKGPISSAAPAPQGENTSPTQEGNAYVGTSWQAGSRF